MNTLEQLDVKYAALTTAAQDLKNAADGNIADLTTQMGTLNTQLGAVTETKDKLAADLAQLQATLIYRDLEYSLWSMNSDKVVGGSGLGTKDQKIADSTHPWAELSIKPDAPIPVAQGGTGDNYFDCYYTKVFKPQPQVKNYRLQTTWKFPTAADAAASQCLEMEARQVVNGLMFIVACQLQFSGGALRYWDSVKKWTASGTKQPRLVAGQPCTVILEGHRDDLNVYHDQITVNGVVVKLGTQYAAQPTNWSARLSCSLQLDGEGAALAYRVNYKDCELRAA